MEDSTAVHRSRPLRVPTTTPVERSPVFPASSGASPWFSPALSSYARTMDEVDQEGAIGNRYMRRSNSREVNEQVRDNDSDMAGVAWDWRTRKWVGDLAKEEDGKNRTKTNTGNLLVDKVLAKGGEGSRRSAHRNRQQMGWVSELEGISEKECHPRRDAEQVVARLRREKIGPRSRRRGYHVLDMRKLESRRKLLRREQVRRDGHPRKSVSDRPQGGGGSATAQQALSLQLLPHESQPTTKSFSLLTLEEYLKERASCHRDAEVDLSSFIGTEVGSPMSGLGSQCHSPSIVAANSLKYVAQTRKTAKKSQMSLPSREASWLNEGLNGQQQQQQQLSEFQVSTYASREAVEDEMDELHRESPGCGGMSWHWPGSQNLKDDNFMDFAGRSCFPVSRRRISRRLVSRSRPAYKWESRVGRYTSERSVSSFDSDNETVPLMTEPEPYNEYSDDLAASSVDFERESPRLEIFGEFKMKRFSRFKEDGRKGSSFHRGGGYVEDEDLQNLPVSRRSLRESTEDKHRSLSQKYRPKSFKELVGQSMVAQSLSNAILKGKIAPVYLFQGPRGTGKTSAARIFTAALNCLSLEELRPCGLCKECGTYAAGKNFDVREVDAAGNNGIESMRLLLKHISLPPSSSRYKVFIIDECHMLTAEAWNAFLKSLEEPPDYVVFILITTDPDQLPRTAVSRCQKFLFPKIKDSDIILRLRKLAVQENVDVDLEALQLIATRSDGSLRDAETTLDQLSLLGKKVTLAIVRELVGLIPDHKLADLLDLALSADTVSTVRSLREFMESGVEPLALISQLATLITNILAGNNKSAVYSSKKVRKDEQERFRQALRILSEAEKQLRSCSDRTTWLTAAFLQFAPSDSCLLPSSSLGTSVTQSPMTFLDTSEKETIELDCAGTRKSWEGEETWDSHSPLQLEYMQASNPGTSKVAGEVRNRLDSHINSFSAPFLDNKIYPCNQSPQSGILVEEMKPAVSAPDTCGGIGQREISTMSPCTMDNIWRKVLEGSRSNVLKQLLRGEGKLLSLSVSEAFAIAHLEFRHPEHKSMAERAKTSIANAFQVALGCPVEVKITLSSLQGEDHFTDRGNSYSVSGISGNHSRHKKKTSLSKADGTVMDFENVPSQDQRRNRSGSFRRSSSSFKNAAPSPRSRNFENKSSKQSFEAEGSTFNMRGTELLNKDDGSTSEQHLGKSKGGQACMLKSHHSVEPHASDKKQSANSHHEVQKGPTFAGGGSEAGLVVQQLDKSADAYNQGPIYGHANGSMKGKAERESGNEPTFSVSLQADDISNDVEKDSSGSESPERYGPSLLCWKGTRMNDGKVKHQRLRRKRRARFLLRLVPCAKGEART